MYHANDFVEKESTEAGGQEPAFVFNPSKLSHLKIINEVFIFEKYGNLKGIEDVNLIVDCGAHIGTASRYLLDKYPESNLMAFEPGPDNFGYLAFNFPNANKNRLPMAYELAVHPFRTEVGLYGNGSDDWKTIDGRNEVCTFPLNELFDFGYKTIDILKISINGAERLLFKKNTQWIEKTRNMAVECDEKSAKIIRDALKGFKYSEISLNDVYFFKDIKKA